MDDQPLKHGILFCLHHKVLKRNWQQKYCVLYRASGYAVQRLEIFESEEAYLRHTSSKLIALNDCLKVAPIYQKQTENAFEVNTKMQTYQFCTSSDQELMEWVQAFQTVAFGGAANMGFPSSLIYSSHQKSQEEQEENQIYCSVYMPEVFTVKIVETDASRTCNLQGHYQLVVGPSYLALREESNSSPQATSALAFRYIWQYQYIRRYGRTSEMFTFEAGRMCASGEGLFQLETPSANSIFLSAQTRMKALKSGDRDLKLSSMELPISHISNISLNNINNNAIPVAKPSGTKPPIPKPPRKSKMPFMSSSSYATTSPSSTKSAISEFGLFQDEPKTSSTVLPLSTKSKISNFENSQLFGTLTSTSTNSSVRSAVLPFPPQTPLPKNPSERPQEPVYSEPEVRKDAWKTFGMESDNIHSECIKKSSDYDYATIFVAPPLSSEKPQPVRQLSETKLVAFVPRPSIKAKNGYDYDHLYQFGEPKETNQIDGHIYSKLLPSPTNSPTEVKSDLQSSSDIVDGPIKKEAKSPPVNPDTFAVEHISKNDEVYAVVTKNQKSATT